MINVNNIKQDKLMEFSLQRKNLLKMLASRIEIEDGMINQMSKNTSGKLKTCLKKFAKSEQNLENIYDLAQNIALDESELQQIERSLTKNLRKLPNQLMSKQAHKISNENETN